MENVITLRSSAISNAQPHDFTTVFIPPIQLNENVDYFLALDSLSMTYSWYNISTTYNNNIVKYSPDGGTTFLTINIPDGIYGYTSLNNLIKAAIKVNGHVDDNFSLIFDKTDYRVKITLLNNYHCY